jgi:small-conductance mechanosensitive channel
MLPEKMRVYVLSLLACLIGVSAPLCFSQTPEAPANAPRPADVLNFLQRTVDWYRRMDTVADSAVIPADILLRENIRQSALKTVQLGFDYARAQAALIPVAAQEPPSNPGANTEGRNFEQATARAAERVSAIQKQIADIETALEKSPARSREILTARLNALRAELALARQVQSTLQNLASFAGVGANNIAADTLTARIRQLENSVPEIRQAAQRSGSPAPAANPQQQGSPMQAVSPQAFHPESAGVFALISEILALRDARAQLRSAIQESDELVNSNGSLRTPLINELRQTIAKSQSLANASAGTKPDELAAAQGEIMRLLGRFKQLSTVTVPLTEQAMAAGATRSSLVQARTAADALYLETARNLLLRVGTLGIAVLAILLLSQLVGRLTSRYIHDFRRRRQFLILRRVAVGFAITLLVTMGFISEFGSVATYAGLLTAGIAVALQNVILSIVAYFFLIGRYGVRVGDRVTISGVTGNVIEIGLVRLYLMEVAGSGATFHPTGRVVVFSNSVLFQPSALFKQIPGTDYVWHTVKLSLTPDSDFLTAQEKLSAAVDSVYAEYRESIEKQHAAFAESVNLEVSVPKPECRLRFADTALEVTVSYPVPLKDASRADDEVMKALYDTIRREPQLKLSPGGVPSLQPA